MTLPVVAEERGQALVVVAGAMALLIAALVLSVEWGYGFTQRRAAQNDADAAALAVGRRLASTFATSSLPFGATVEELCLEAARFTDPTSAEVLTVSFTDDGQTVVAFTDASGASADSVSTDTCATGSGSQLPATAVFVRVRSARTYPSVFGGAFGRTTLDAGASARSRLTASPLVRPLQIPPDPACPGCAAGNGVSGLSTAPSVAIWPILRYFDPAEVAGWTACGAFCDRSLAPIPLWQSGGPSSTFRGLIAPTHDAIRGSGHQLVTESDWSGSPPGLHGHLPTSALQTHGQPGCNATWDTRGSPDLLTAAHCDVPNWFFYGYRGSLSLDTDWAFWFSRGYSNGAIMPMSLPSGATRSSCQGVPAYFPHPSCSAPLGAHVGDWVQTINGRVSCSDGDDCDDQPENLGDLTPTMLGDIRQFIAQYGRELPNSGGFKAVVVNVFFWDCAEGFSSGHWSAASNATCDRITDNATLRRIGRVHLFTIAPFTVYADGVPLTNDRILAYFGDAFGDAGVCGRVPTPSTGCDLNPLMNSAFLVPDE